MSGGPERPTFVVCTGRCGSTMVSNALRLHPEILSLSETLYSLDLSRIDKTARWGGDELRRLLRAPNRRITYLYETHQDPPEFLYPIDDERSPWSRSTAPPALAAVTLPHLVPPGEDVIDHVDRALGRLDGLAATVAPGTLPQVLVSLFDAWARAEGRRRWVERSGGSLAWTRALRAWYPSARFIWLSRSGPETALSMSRHPVPRLSLANLRAVARGHRPDRDRLVARSEAFRPVNFAFLWSNLTMEGARTLRDLGPDDLLVVRYEELCADPATGLARISRFLGCDDDALDDWIGVVGPTIRPPTRDIDPRLRDELRRACRPGEEVLARVLRERAPDQRAAAR